MVEVYASGADFNSATVLYREFMSLGEPICFTGLSPGAVITATQGFYGMGEQRIGNQESPMPLMSLGLAFTSSFVYAFVTLLVLAQIQGRLLFVMVPSPRP